VTESAGGGGGPATGVKPGALTELLRQVAASPERREDEPPPLLPGTVVGSFEVVREVGRGGFGVVYEARDRELGRLAALKVVRAGAAVDEEGRVVREAEAIARLSHPNLITLHDLGRSERGPYLVFEFLYGKTLQERLDVGPLQVQVVVPWDRVALGLELPMLPGKPLPDPREWCRGLLRLLHRGGSRVRVGRDPGHHGPA
jgi:serine/threonine protein kinase